MKDLSGAQAVGIALWWYRPSYGQSQGSVIKLMSQDGRPAGFYPEDVTRALEGFNVDFRHLCRPDPFEVFLHLQTGGSAIVRIDNRGGYYVFVSAPSGWLWDALARIDTRIRRYAWMLPPRKESE